jgi:hypothetical protein
MGGFDCNVGEGHAGCTEAVDGIVWEIAQLDAEYTEREVEQETTWCQGEMCSILDAMGMKIGICTRSKS